MSHERIIRGAEIDEPVPLSSFPEQNGSSVKRVRHHGGPTVRDEISFLDHMNVPKPSEQGRVSNVSVEILSLLGRRSSVQMNHVAVVGMVESQKGSPEGLPVAGGSGNQVSESRRIGEGGDGFGFDLGLGEGGRPGSG